MLKHTLILIVIILISIYIGLSLQYRVQNDFLLLLSTTSLFIATVFLIVSLSLKKFRFMAYGIYVALSLVCFSWYFNINPSNDRDWQKDVALLSHATINNNLITVHNIRNIKYKTESDYEVSYYDDVFNLNKLDGIYFVATYWMGKSIAHTFLSFSFSDGKYLAISIEARKEKGEDYSILDGFFKGNELYYVVANEQDLIGLRTNIRKNPPEHVYMYKIKAKQEDEKKVFLNYIEKLNTLKNKPEFYNTLTTNCTTTMWHNSLINPSNISFNWKILLSGYTAKYLYDKGLLENDGLSFEELQKRAYINGLVNDKEIDESYSLKIRALE